MSRRRGRPPRHYRLRVRTVRRTPIDYDALARAALEQAAMNQPQDQENDADAPPVEPTRHRQQRLTNRSEDPRHDRLA
jgi:hypothetical protein